MNVALAPLSSVGPLSRQAGLLPKPEKGLPFPFSRLSSWACVVHTTFTVLLALGITTRDPKNRRTLVWIHGTNVRATPFSKLKVLEKRGFAQSSVRTLQLSRDDGYRRENLVLLCFMNYDKLQTCGFELHTSELRHLSHQVLMWYFFLKTSTYKCMMCMH